MRVRRTDYGYYAIHENQGYELHRLDSGKFACEGFEDGTKEAIKSAIKMRHEATEVKREDEAPSSYVLQDCIDPCAFVSQVVLDTSDVSLAAIAKERGTNPAVVLEAMKRTLDAFGWIDPETREVDKDRTNREFRRLA